MGRAVTSGWVKLAQTETLPLLPYQLGWVAAHMDSAGKAWAPEQTLPSAAASEI